MAYIQAINLKALNWGSIKCTYQLHHSAKDFRHIHSKVRNQVIPRQTLNSGQSAELKVSLPSIAGGRSHMLTGQETSHD